MSESLPKIRISDATPLETAVLRDNEFFQSADPEGLVPDVRLVAGELNPYDRPRAIATRVGIDDVAGQRVGALNLVQTDGRSWINDIRINKDRTDEKLGVATYLGVMAAVHRVGRHLESDPQGLSEDSTRVWRSLVRRGVAQVVEQEHDQHGNPKFVSVAPKSEK